jgi:hypothetical protein
MTTDLGIQPAWERRKEIGFFKSIFLTIRGVMFQPSETFSRFKWDGGYWNPILFNFLGAFVVLLITSIYLHGYGLISGLSFKQSFGFSGLELIGDLIVVLGGAILSLSIFSALVLGILKVLRVKRPSYQGIFRIVAYASILVGILNMITGVAICAVLPKSLWNPLQSLVCILLMIWQGYCIAVGISKTGRVPIWKPFLAVAIAMTLAFGAQEMTSISNPIGQKIWEGIYHGITGNHFSS